MSFYAENSSIVYASSFHAENYSEESLCALLQQGNTEAFSYACSQHYPRLLRTASRIMRDSSDAQDAVQDALLSAFKAMRSFKAASSISTWLTRIVINSCLVQLRKRRRRPLISLEGSYDEAVPLTEVLQDVRVKVLDDLLANEEREMFARAIEGLPPESRRAILLYQRSETSLKALAKEERISLPALKSRVLRAKRVLKRECQAGQIRSRVAHAMM